MSEEQVARVYAQALFDAAKEAGVVEPVRRELGDFVAALAASAPLRDVLADPQIETAAKRRVLAEITRGGQPLRRQHAAAHARARPLRRRCPSCGRPTTPWPSSRRASSRSRSSRPSELTPETEKKIAARVEEATGRRVELARRVDPSILGGLVLRIGDVIVDGSVKARDPPAAPPAGYRRSER